MRFSAKLLCLGLLFLSSCAGPAAKTYSYTLPETPGGRICTNQCTEAQDYCHQDCDLDQRRCFGKIQAQAIQDYDTYTREQFANHQPMELRPRDFERTASCDEDKKSCTNECERHFQLCYGSCGGKVDVTTSCQFLCF